MLKVKRAKFLLFRWRSLISSAFLLLPLLALFILGLVWLYEHDGFVWFAVVCLTISALVWGLQVFAKRGGAAEFAEEKSHPAGIEANPEWSEAERRVFERACARIEHDTRALVPWEALPRQALAVIENIAGTLDNEKRTPLDFSAPEALLLLERTARRYREHLRANLPYADQISIGRLHWFWRRRKSLVRAWQIADGGRRIFRLASNPALGVIREIEQLASDRNTSYLSDQMLSTLQTLLLEEVAAAAIDLYSGRLRFSPEELRAAELYSTRADRARMTEVNEPLRILLIGQISAGKSSLLNHLLAQDRAETDWPQTTDNVRAYVFEFGGYPVHILDSPGIDGTVDNRARLLSEITDSDLVIWLHKVDRPSREPDLALLRACADWRAAHPQRRAPIMLHSLTFIDRLDPAWPFPEHSLPAAFEQRLEAALRSVAKQLSLGDDAPTLLALSNREGGWNLGGLAHAIENAAPEAAMVQKQRKRLQAAGVTKSARKNAARGARGVLRGTRKVGARWLRKAGYLDRQPGDTADVRDKGEQ